MHLAVRSGLDPVRREELLRREAARVLEQVLDDPLTDFGDVGFVGSYPLRLMTRRDLNLFVGLATDIDPLVAFDLGKRLAGRLAPTCMNYRDELGGQSSRLPRGLGWTIRLDRGFPHPWTLDVWLVDIASFEAARTKIADLCRRLSPDARRTILKLKSKLCYRPAYRQSFFSEDIHEAVLDYGVASLTTLRRCLRRRGVRL